MFLHILSICMIYYGGQLPATDYGHLHNCGSEQEFGGADYRVLGTFLFCLKNVSGISDHVHSLPLVML